MANILTFLQFLDESVKDKGKQKLIDDIENGIETSKPNSNSNSNSETASVSIPTQISTSTLTPTINEKPTPTSIMTPITTPTPILKPEKKSIIYYMESKITKDGNFLLSMTEPDKGDYEKKKISEVFSYILYEMILFIKNGQDFENFGSIIKMQIDKFKDKLLFVRIYEKDEVKYDDLFTKIDNKKVIDYVKNLYNFPYKIEDKYDSVKNMESFLNNIFSQLKNNPSENKIFDDLISLINSEFSNNHRIFEDFLVFSILYGYKVLYENAYFKIIVFNGNYYSSMIEDEGLIRIQTARVKKDSIKPMVSGLKNGVGAITLSGLELFENGDIVRSFVIELANFIAENILNKDLNDDILFGYWASKKKHLMKKYKEIKKTLYVIFDLMKLYNDNMITHTEIAVKVFNKIHECIDDSLEIKEDLDLLMRIESDLYGNYLKYFDRSENLTRKIFILFEDEEMFKEISEHQFENKYNIESKLIIYFSIYNIIINLKDSIKEIKEFDIYNEMKESQNELIENLKKSINAGHHMDLADDLKHIYNLFLIKITREINYEKFREIKDDEIKIKEFCKIFNLIYQERVDKDKYFSLKFYVYSYFWINKILKEEPGKNINLINYGNFTSSIKEIKENGKLVKVINYNDVDTESTNSITYLIEDEGFLILQNLESYGDESTIKNIFGFICKIYRLLKYTNFLKNIYIIDDITIIENDFDDENKKINNEDYKKNEGKINELLKIIKDIILYLNETEENMFKLTIYLFENIMNELRYDTELKNAFYVYINAYSTFWVPLAEKFIVNLKLNKQALFR